MPSRGGGRCPHGGTGALGAGVVLALLVVGALWPAGVPAPLGPARADAAAATRVRVRAAFGQLPLSFEPNVGQSDAAVQFLARGPGDTLFLPGPAAEPVPPDARAGRGGPPPAPAPGPSGPGGRGPHGAAGLRVRR